LIEKYQKIKAAFLDDPLSALLAGQKKLVLQTQTAFVLTANCAGAGAPSAERYAGRSGCAEYYLKNCFSD